MKSGNKPEAGKVKVRIPKQNRISKAQPDATKSSRYYDHRHLSSSGDELLDDARCPIAASSCS